jgi:erythromycin esterase
VLAVTDGEVTRWLATRARPLAAPDDLVEDAPADGVATWVRASAGARVVALGPAVGGTRELPQLVHRVLDGLVADGGVHTLALQASESGATLLDAHVRHGAGSAGDALLALGSWSWNTREVLDLVRDLADRGPAALRVVGVDPRRPAIAVRVVGTFLRTAAPDALPPVAEALADLALGSGDDRTRVAADRVRARLDRDVPALIAATSPERYAEAVRHATYLVRAAELAAAPRHRADAVAGRLMAESVLEALDAGGPDERLVLWAHADHVVVRDDPPTAGAHLRERLGDDYRALVVSAGEGATRALRRRRLFGPTRTPHLQRLSEPPEGSLEADVLAACPRDAAVDLRALRDPGTPTTVTAWASAPSSRRSVGDEVSAAAPARAVVPCAPGTELDGFAVVRTVQSARAR